MHSHAFLGCSTCDEAVVISLRSGSGSLIENPTSTDISAALTALHSVEDVLTVSDGGGLSIQAAPAGNAKFSIEYRDSSADEHYVALTPALSYSTFIKLFCHFAKQNPNWRTVIRWKHRAEPLKQAEQPERLAQREQADQRQQAELSPVYMIGCLAVALLVQIMIVAFVYRGLESGWGVAVPIVVIPFFILAGILTPLGLSEAAAVAVAMALAFLVLDIAVLIQLSR